MDFIQTYAWIFWLVLILIFVILEVITIDFISLMLAVGSVGGLIISLFSLPIWLQVVVAAVIALLLLFTVRPPLKRALGRGSDHARTLVDALMGMKGVVTVDFNGKPNIVKLANGETWTAERAHTTEPELKEGDQVVVTAINGSTAIVEPAERTTKK
ncbi:MAG TPA: NfeD family protein [Galbitalea sp.]|jgi:membrane protein implicated in regulation of membrane protease activity|nr:NfeD family protein [Galbitalea sp.]